MELRNITKIATIHAKRMSSTCSNLISIIQIIEQSILNVLTKFQLNRTKNNHMIVGESQVGYYSKKKSWAVNFEP